MKKETKHITKKSHQTTEEEIKRKASKKRNYKTARKQLTKCQ